MLQEELFPAAGAEGREREREKSGREGGGDWRRREGIKKREGVKKREGGSDRKETHRRETGGKEREAAKEGITKTCLLYYTGHYTGKTSFPSDMHYWPGVFWFCSIR